MFVKTSAKPPLASKYRCGHRRLGDETSVALDSASVGVIEGPRGLYKTGAINVAFRSFDVEDDLVVGAGGGGRRDARETGQRPVEERRWHNGRPIGALSGSL
jgi:hypothetical protein